MYYISNIAGPLKQVINNDSYGTIFVSREGFKPPVQSHASYEASASHPSHHGWINLVKLTKFIWGMSGHKQLNKSGATSSSMSYCSVTL